MSKPSDASPLPPFSIDSLPWEEWSEGPRFGSRVKRLADSRQGARIGVIIEELPPGKQTCPFHFHMLEEEHVMVLEGSMTLRLGEQEFILQAADYIRFPAGQPAGHCFINHTDQLCRFLCFGDRQPHDVIVYPDSGKVSVRATGEIYASKPTLQYWDGEA